MTLEQLLDCLPHHLKLAVKDVRLSPNLGFSYPARFETLLDASRWVKSEAANRYRLQGEQPPQVTLATLIQHVSKVRPVVVEALKLAISQSKN